MILSQSNTLLEDIEAARKAGFTSDFMYRDNKLLCRTNKMLYEKHHCELVEYCRHEGMSDPSDGSILFLITCYDGVKGCLTSGYGLSEDQSLIAFVLSLEKSKRVN